MPGGDAIGELRFLNQSSEQTHVLVVSSEERDSCEEIGQRMISELRTALRDTGIRVPLVATVGSLEIGLDYGDVDVLAILGDDDEDLLEVSSRHNELLRLLGEVMDGLKNDGLCVSMFPEFRLKEATRFLSTQNGSDEACGGCVLLHLKTYPSPSRIRLWQTGVVARSMLMNIREILYADERGLEIMERLGEALPIPSKEERLEFLHMILHETTEYMIVKALPEKFRQRECWSNLAYVTRYLSAEILNQEEPPDYSSRVWRSWGEIIDKADRLPQPLSRVVEFIHTMKTHGTVPTMVELERSYKDVYAVLVESISHK